MKNIDLASLTTTASDLSHRQDPGVTQLREMNRRLEVLVELALQQNALLRQISSQLPAAPESPKSA